jgi:hypothetical protein
MRVCEELLCPSISVSAKLALKHVHTIICTQEHSAGTHAHTHGSCNDLHQHTDVNETVQAAVPLQFVSV